MLPDSQSSSLEQDDAVYSVEIVPPERDEFGAKYAVDLVRNSVDSHGLGREQRLTIGQHNSLMEAEEHLDEVEQKRAEDGLAGWGDDVERLREQPYTEEVFYLAVTYPPDAPDPNTPTTAHLLAVGEQGITDAPLAVGGRNDVEQVVARIDTAFAEEGIDTGLKVAEREAELSEVKSRESALFDAPSTQPEYDFRYGIGTNDHPSLEAVKTWRVGSEQQIDTLTLGEYGTFDEASVDKHELETMRDELGLESAMNLAETMAVAGEHLDPERDDPRLFTQGPLDTFQTMREEDIDHDLAQYGVTWREAHEWATEAAQTPEVEANLENNKRVLEPLDPNVNYALVVQTDDPDKLELVLEKSWQGTDGVVETASQTLQIYDDYDTMLDDRDGLLDVYDERGLQAMMHKAELQATKNEHLDPHRADLGLFDAGPPDRFITLAQQLDGEVNPYWNVADETETVIENPYWRLDTIPVNDPEDEPLGHALHMVVYDGVAQNPDQIGTPTLSENQPFRMLEMTHFETTEDADKFGKEFKGYLIPDVLEGPELAEEVAKLEGHPVEWKTLEGDELKEYQSGELTLTREPSDWHPYNPNAEQDARIETEGLSTDPIWQSRMNDIEF